ncbi:hypothetical protein L9F63_015539, partial [Diploptera punctata]
NLKNIRVTCCKTVRINNNLALKIMESEVQEFQNLQNSAGHLFLVTHVVIMNR